MNNKSIKMKFPKDEGNLVYDGKMHDIVPIELISFLINDMEYYCLRYKENGDYGVTLLGKSEDGYFFKIPLDDYDYLFDYLESGYLQSESIDLLDRQDYINTVEIQNAEQFFVNGVLHSNSGVSFSGLVPPNLRIGIVSPQTPPSDTLMERINESKKLSETAFSELPPDPKVPNVDDEKEVRLYIGVYGFSYADYLQIDRSENDVVENKFRFGRNLYNKKLMQAITNFLFSRLSGETTSELHLDYGVNGEETYLVESNLYNLSDNVSQNEYGRIYGKYKYIITVVDFMNYDDFNKFISANIVECRITDDMNLRVTPENHATVFLSLSSSDIYAKFKDSYGRAAFNSFAENQDMNVRRSK